MSNRVAPRRARLLALVTSFLVLGVTACREEADAPVGTPAPAPANDASAQFSRLVDEIIARHLEAAPHWAVRLGLHRFDGRLPDFSETGLARERAFLAQDQARLEAVDARAISAEQRVELATLLLAIRGSRFALEEWRTPWRNPMFYLGPLALVAYVSRDYAPIEERARAIVSIGNATPAHLAAAQRNLEPALPRSWIETALLVVRGSIAFVRDDVPEQMVGVGDAELRAELDRALTTMSAALEGFAGFLEARKAEASDEYALGEVAFLRMLRETQGISIDLSRLEALCRADLARNQLALVEAAAAIDPGGDVTGAVALVTGDKPAPDAVLRVATDQGRELQRFVVERNLVTIPSDDPVVVTDTPPFMRWNWAFLNAAGPFESESLPSFYYITPPDPSWPVEQQRAYVRGKADLLFASVHEVWPGHFLHMLHIRSNESRVARMYGNTAMVEGWAHYAEELVWEAGLSDDPRVHVGQLLNALLRDVRCASAIGLHTKGMSVEESARLFRELAHQDEANASQQAVRGTFDPMYLAYTVGKLGIRKLRDDYRAKLEAEGRTFSLRDFHDAFLSYGMAPLPAIRDAMLGPDAGPLL